MFEECPQRAVLTATTQQALPDINGQVVTRLGDIGRQQTAFGWRRKTSAVPGRSAPGAEVGRRHSRGSSASCVSPAS